MKYLVLAAASALALTAVTAASALAAPAAPAAPMINNFYVDVYGGERLANVLDYEGTAYDLGAGSTFGATVGMNFGQGLSADLDVMQVNSYYTCCSTSDVLDSTSFMADLNYTAWLADSFGVFAGVGAGVIHLNYDNSDYGFGAGGQIKVGAIAKISDMVSIFGEAKFQEALGGSINVGSPSSYPIQDNNTSILAGLRFSMP